MQTFRCYKCKENKSQDQFYKSTRSMRGIDDYCIPCRRARSKRYYAENPEPNKARSRQWGKDNVEYRRERERRDYAAGKSKKYKIHNAHVRRIRLDQVKCEYIDINKLYERDKGICGLCDEHVKVKDASIDHKKPISQGGEHTWENVQLAHLSCNCRRGTMSVEDYRHHLHGLRHD